MKFIKRLLCEEKGTTSIEYALIALLIAIVLVGTGVLNTIGDTVKGFYQSVSDGFE